MRNGLLRLLSLFLLISAGYCFAGKQFDNHCIEPFKLWKIDIDRHSNNCYFKHLSAGNSPISGTISSQMSFFGFGIGFGFMNLKSITWKDSSYQLIDPLLFAYKEFYIGFPTRVASGINIPITDMFSKIGPPIFSIGWGVALYRKERASLFVDAAIKADSKINYNSLRSEMGVSLSYAFSAKDKTK